MLFKSFRLVKRNKIASVATDPLTLLLALLLALLCRCCAVAVSFDVSGSKVVCRVFVQRRDVIIRTTLYKVKRVFAKVRDADGKKVLEISCPKLYNPFAGRLTITLNSDEKVV